MCLLRQSICGEYVLKKSSEKSKKLKPTDPVDGLPQPTQGRTNADVTVRVFQDFRASATRQFVDDHSRDLYIHYIKADYPLADTLLSLPAAEIARGVQDRVGESAFWEFRKRILNFQDAYNTRQSLIDAAVNLGINRRQARADFLSHRYQNVVLENKRRGEKLSSSASLSPERLLVFVNDTLVKPTFETISDTIVSLDNRNASTD